MKNKVKFLMIGAVMTGMFSMAQAHDGHNHVKHDDIKSSVQTIIKKQIEKGMYTESSEINLKIVEPKKVTLFNKETKEDYEKDEYDLSGNTSQRFGDICKINLAVDNFGNIPFLGHDKELMDVTKFQNERQKEIARQFIALHEQSHCEFGSIANPVVLKGANAQLVAQSNMFLKDFEVMNINWGSGGKELNYLTTVNESYSDVSAMIVLIQEYGANDPDLKYVLKAIEVQRNDNYLQVGAEVHDTHIAIQKLLTPKNIEKIDTLKDAKSLKAFALEIANDGVQNLMTQRKEFADKAFSKENFAFSVMVNMLRLVKYELLPAQEKKDFQINMWKSGIETGYTYKIAQELLKDVDLSKYNFEVKEVPGKINIDQVSFAGQIMSEPVKEKAMEIMYKKFREVTQDFKDQMYQNHEKHIVDFNSAATKEEVMKRVNTLRQSFLKETQGLSQNPSVPK